MPDGSAHCNSTHAAGTGILNSLVPALGCHQAPKTHRRPLINCRVSSSTLDRKPTCSRIIVEKDAIIVNAAGSSIKKPVKCIYSTIKRKGTKTKNVKLSEYKFTPQSN